MYPKNEASVKASNICYLLDYEINLDCASAPSFFALSFCGYISTTCLYEINHLLLLLLLLFRYNSLHCDPLRSVTTRYTSLHFVTLRYTSLHFVTLRYISLHFVTFCYEFQSASSSSSSSSSGRSARNRG